VGKRLAIFTIENASGFLWDDEPILRAGVPVGWVTSAAFGHTVGCPMAMGYVRHADGVDRAFIESGRYEIERAGERLPARTHRRAPYDPDGSRLRS
jgi:glycine cleavage system aminomethyltransferase T